MLLKKNPVILFLLLIISGSIQAQSWQAIEGRYARVEYRYENAALADSLLEIAELSMPRLAKIFKLPEQKISTEKVRIILSDSPDIANGYALSNSVVIYAISSMYMSNWTGPRTWYEQVLIHELAHYLTFIKTRRKLNFFGELASLTIPRWFYEGIAQYYTEDWNTYRGDIYVRNAVLSGNLTYQALDNLEEGRLLYAAAHAFVRFLADQYDDSSLVRLMEHNPKGWYIDFDEAFEETYGKSPQSAFTDFIRHMVLYYGDLLAEYPVANLSEKPPSFGYKTFQGFPLNDQDSLYLVSVQQEENQLYRMALMVRIKNKKQKTLTTITNRLNTDLVLSKDGNLIAYGQYSAGYKDDQTKIGFNWKIYDRLNKKTQTVVSDIRAREAAFDSEGNLILCAVNPQASVFTRYAQKDGAETELFRSAMPVGKFALLPDNHIVFSAQRQNGNRDLFLYADGAVVDLTNDPVDDRNPVVIADSLIVFNRYVNHNPALAILNPLNRSLEIKLDDQNAYWIDGYDPFNQKLIVSTWSAEGNNEFALLPLDSLLRREFQAVVYKPKVKYASWTNKIPQTGQVLELPDTSVNHPPANEIKFPQMHLHHIFSFALPTYERELGFGLYGLTSWLEPLQRQVIAASFILFQNDFDQSLLALSHGLVLYNSNLYTTYYHGPVIFSHQNKNYLNLYQDFGTIEWNKKFYFKGNPRTAIQPALAYGAYYYQLHETLTDIPDNFGYHGPALGLRLSYLLPTTYYPALPKREFDLNLKYFKSLNFQYDFGITQLDVKLATNLFWEELGVKSNFSYITKHGKMPLLKVIGVDRFYEFDFPRDFKYTKPLRGIREDYSGNGLYWAANDLTWYLAQNTSYSILFIPVNHLALSAFFDWALVEDVKNATSYSYGAELSFGEELYRLGFGSALGRYADHSKENSFYFRISLFMPTQ